MNIDTFIVGYGGIGRELLRQIKWQGWNVRYIAKSDGPYVLDSRGEPNLLKRWTMLESDFHHLRLSGISVAFIATPPSSGGKLARDYACLFARQGIQMVVCDKSLIAHYPCYTDSVGFTATVGGGSHLLPFVKEHVRGCSDVIVHIILNATLNFVMSGEKSLADTAQEVIDLHMAEPEAGDCLVTLNNEINDTVLKTCIVANHCFPPERMVEDVLALKPGDVISRHLNKVDLARLEAEKQNRRYIVSFSREKPNDSDIIAGFDLRTVNGWHISAGFKRIDSDPQFVKLTVTDANNAALVCNGKDDPHPSYLIGPGAGPEPTARAMIQDAKRLLHVH